MESSNSLPLQALHPHLLPGTGKQLQRLWSFLTQTNSPHEYNEETVAALMAKVQEKERKLIGQELHDNVNQILLTVKLFLEMQQPADAKEEWIQKKTVEYVLMAIDEIRKISWEMVQPTLEEKELVDSILQIIDDIHFATPVKIIFNHSKNIERLSSDKKTSLLRIVQEQIKNIIKYSEATRVNIDITLRKGQVTLTIEDNGIGFDPKETRSGIGFSNIGDRTLSHKGVMVVQSAKGCGCTLTVSLPV